MAAVLALSNSTAGVFCLSLFLFSFYAAAGMNVLKVVSAISILLLLLFTCRAEASYVNNLTLFNALSVQWKIKQAIKITHHLK